MKAINLLKTPSEKFENGVKYTWVPGFFRKSAEGRVSKKKKLRLNEAWKLLSLGFSNKEIAEKMGRSEQSVHTYVAELKQAHNVNSRVALALKFHGVEI